ncbi:hypothetical protein, partial [Citrobacter koseri]|uniref:hypothetical protein n=1 Tax=Citrobacter koseri TaxID=545 RepID=UPI001E423D90
GGVTPYPAYKTPRRPGKRSATGRFAGWRRNALSGLQIFPVGPVSAAPPGDSPDGGVTPYPAYKTYP